MGSIYEVDEKTARAMRKRMQEWLQKNPTGTRFSETFEGEKLDLIVTGFSKCPKDEKQECHIELKHLQIGGFANFTVDVDKHEIKITGADFPYPAEFFIARKYFVDIHKDEDWCIVPQGEYTPKFCSKQRW